MIATSRELWLAQLEALTALHREGRARAYETRGSALALQRRRLFRLSGMVARTARGRPTGAAPRESAWHSSRADGKRRLFRKLARCAEGHTLELICRNSACGERFTVPMGCGASMLCRACRKRRADAFRVDFQRKQLGLLAVAHRAGLTHRYRRRSEGGRFSERLVTLTVPHADEFGTPYGVRDRIRLLRETWTRFWRLFRDELRGKLRGLSSGITLENSEVGLPMPRGKAAPRDELALLDLVSHLRVLEWTPGEDMQGHPHFHVWLFSPFIERARLQLMWSRAFADVTQPERVCTLLVVDVRRADECEGGLASELVKYLTKDWQITSDGAKRVAPEVFAQVYVELDGTRTRQSSAGLAHWAAAKEKSCPCCAFSSEREHWARVFVNHAIQEASNAPSKVLEFPPVPGAGVAPRTRSGELQEIENTRRDAEWRDSFERRILVRRLGIVRPPEAVLPVLVQLPLFET